MFSVSKGMDFVITNKADFALPAQGMDVFHHFTSLP